MPRKPATTPRKLPKQDRSRVTVEAILEATTHILTEEGYDRANTNRIAELLAAYLDRWRDRISPQNLELTVFMLS